MKLVIAPDSFKGKLDSLQAARIIGQAAEEELDRPEVIIRPIGDGGEGTAGALAGTDGEMIPVVCVDPLGRAITGEIWRLADGDTVALDLASASGLGLLVPEERNPLTASTAGTGDCIRRALDLGARRLIIGLGGSATVDGGAGMLGRLGVRFLDRAGRELAPQGDDLDRVETVDLAAVDTRLRDVELVVAADVDNPLTGPQGAASVFGPQKGARPEDVERLDRRLARLGRAYERACGHPIADVRSAGAAGGAGAALLTLGAKLLSGIEVVLDAVRFDELISGADVVITGEGRLDSQTLRGKAIAGIARRCARAGVPVMAMVGAWDPGVDPSELGLLAAFDATFETQSRQPLTSERAARLLRLSARQVFRLLRCAKNWR